MKKLTQWCSDVLEQILPVFILALMLFTMLLIVTVIIQTGNVMIDSVKPNPGCIASAYQATQNGFDLEANLAACEN
jgi:hypothetical protein